MIEVYTHDLGNESSQDLLLAYGIDTKRNNKNSANAQESLLAPKICHYCSEPNKHDAKICASCKGVMTYDQYKSLTTQLEEAKERAKELEALKTRLNGIESKFGSMIQSWEQFKEAIFYDKKFTLDSMRMKLGLNSYQGLDEGIIYAAEQTDSKLEEAKKETTFSSKKRLKRESFERTEQEKEGRRV